MDLIRGFVLFAASACLLAACNTATPPVLKHQVPVSDNLVLAEGSLLATTASAEQQQLIRALARSGREQSDLAPVTVDYPMDGTIFPPEIIPPTFLWHDEANEADRWLVDVANADGRDRFQVLVWGVPPPQGEIDPMAVSTTNEIYTGTPYQRSARSWKPSTTIWSAIKKCSARQPATVTFLGYSSEDPGRVVSTGSTTITTSADPVGAPIFYRDVPLAIPEEEDNIIMPLPKAVLPTIAWRLRDISLPESRLMLTDMPTCANCHSFSADGETLGMDIDGPQGDKGAYAFASIEKEMTIEKGDVITRNSFEEKKHKTLGFMSRVSPDGRYAVTTLNERTYVANFPDYKFSQVFYPTRGILAYYSAETGEMKALPGADDPEFVQTSSVWSPDGRTIVFIRAKASDPFPPGRPMATYAGDPNELPMRYDLYRLPFNEGRGGLPEPIAGASNNGMSNSFPKVSPDGKWIVFVKCKNGLLMRPDSRLWIVPFEGGTARLMNANLSPMNSWHSFSPNGRWLVFSSKGNTPYTQMFLTHIDEDGNDSPAVLIENATAANRAVNLPEFINRPYDEFASLRVDAIPQFRHYARGQELAREGRLREAAGEYEKALELEPDEARIANVLSRTLLKLGDHEAALKYTHMALELSPLNFEMHVNYGFLLAQMGDVETGLGHMSAAIRINPLHPQLWYNRATLHLQRQELDLALSDYNEALKLEPRYPAALNGRALLLHARGRLQAALSDLENSVAMNPKAVEPWYFMAVLRRDTGDLRGALESIDTARANVTLNSPRREQIETLHRELTTALSVD